MVIRRTIFLCVQSYLLFQAHNRIIFFEFKICVQLLVNYKICKFSEFLWAERYSWLFLVWSSLQRLAARCEKNKNEQKLKLPFCHFASGMLAWLLALLCSYQCQTLLSTWDHWTLWTQVDTSPNPSNKLANHEQGILPLWFFTFLFLISSKNYGCCSGHNSQKKLNLNFQTAEKRWIWWTFC